MLKDSWNNLTIICGNHGDDHSHVMKLKNGPHSVFYSCPEYKSIYGDDHEGRSCNNRLTLVDFERCLDHLMDEAYPDGSFEPIDLTGYSWSQNGVEYTVLDQDEDKFTVLMLNKRAIAK